MFELLEFAEKYYLTKINVEAWNNLTPDMQEKYLAEALRQVESVDGINLPNVLNDELKTAICEVCLEILNSSDSETFSKLQRAGVTSISYGNDSVSFNKNMTTAKTSNCYINDYTYSLLLPYIQRSYRIV